MLTADEMVAKMKADLCSTQSRSKNGQKFTNKYTKYFGNLGYSGINKNGVFTKKYSYGVVGHCCIGVQYWLCQGGYSKLVPKSPKYLFNTNTYRNWLKKQPKISGLGQVKWTTDPSKAKKGAVAFKGKSSSAKNATHTCCFIQYKDGYVYTVDFNVSDGKGHNNGTLHKRKKKYFLGFANLPYVTSSGSSDSDTSGTTTTTYKVGSTYTLKSNMYVRTAPKTTAEKVKYTSLTEDAQKCAIKSTGGYGILKRGTKVTCKAIKNYTESTWIKIPSGWVCANNSTKTYIG